MNQIFQEKYRKRFSRPSGMRDLSHLEKKAPGMNSRISPNGFKRTAKCQPCISDTLPHMPSALLGRRED